MAAGRSASEPDRRTIMPTDSLPLVNVVTHGVRDLATTRAFYRTLGWPQVVDDDDFCAFELRGGIVALFPIGSLAADARATPQPRGGGIRSSIEIIVDRPQAVDEVAARWRGAGGRITKDPVDAEFFVGRSAYV